MMCIQPESFELKIHVLNLAQVRTVYRERLIRDFPSDEVKPLSMIERALKRGDYRCYGGFSGDTLWAYAFFVTVQEQGKALWLFDYLAVEENHRDQGIGSAFLQALDREILPEADIVLLEIDDPDHAEGAERIRRLRRAAFYSRNGLIDIGVTACVFGADFRILEIPLHGRHSPDECHTCYSACYRHMLPPMLYKRMVHIT